MRTGILGDGNLFFNWLFIVVIVAIVVVILVILISTKKKNSHYAREKKEVTVIKIESRTAGNGLENLKSRNMPLGYLHSSYLVTFEDELHTQYCFVISQKQRNSMVEGQRGCLIFQGELFISFH